VAFVSIFFCRDKNIYVLCIISFFSLELCGVKQKN